MRVLLAILLLVTAARSLPAQDLTGQWTGRSFPAAGDNHSSFSAGQKLVLDISAKDSLFGGVMHWYYPGTQDFKHFVVSGRFHGDSLLSVMEDSLSAGQRGDDDRDPTGMYVLSYRKAGGREVLEGYWRGLSKNNPGKNRGVSIRLERKLGPLLPPIPPFPHRKDSTGQKQWLSLLSRESPVAATISLLQHDSVELELYDNGEIDGDSVSIYLNERLIAAHLKLDDKPKLFKLALDKSLPVNKLILFAENLGTIAPNTALMEVNTNGKKYNIFLSTDFRRNAMVEFALTE